MRRRSKGYSCITLTSLLARRQRQADVALLRHCLSTKHVLDEQNHPPLLLEIIYLTLHAALCHLSVIGSQWKACLPLAVARHFRVMYTADLGQP